MFCVIVNKLIIHAYVIIHIIMHVYDILFPLAVTDYRTVAMSAAAVVF